MAVLHVDTLFCQSLSRPIYVHIGVHTWGTGGALASPNDSGEVQIYLCLSFFHTSMSAYSFLTQHLSVQNAHALPSQYHL